MRIYQEVFNVSRGAGQVNIQKTSCDD